MAPAPDWNRATIEEFRANGGKVGGRWEGRPLLLLTTTGERTGRPHTTPAVYLREGDRIFVFASKGGSPRHPQWYRNLVANPEVTVELGSETYRARAVTLTGAARDVIYRRQVEVAPQFGEYQRQVEGVRVIPVVELTQLTREPPLP